MKSRKSAVAALTVGIFVPLAALGDLDPSFGDAGLVSLRIGSFGAAAFAGIQQPDGKLVLAGVAGDDFAVVRLLGNGETDPGFSIDGVAKADFFGFQDIANAVVLQSDGKIVISGSAWKADGTTDIAVARFNSSGGIDPSFGDAGKVTVDLEGGADFAQSMAIAADGDLILAGGTIDGSGVTKAVLISLNDDGSLDTAFGTDGVATFELLGSHSWINDVELQADGKVVITGFAPGASGSDILIARTTAYGDLDPGFSEDGALFVDVEGDNDEGYSIAIQPDSKIVIGGYARLGESERTAAVLVRVNGDGSPDAGFGTGGIAPAELGGDSSVMSLALDPDGKIVATGWLSRGGAGPDTMVARFRADGTTDVGFGDGGVEIVDYGHGADAPISEGDNIVRQSDGRYVAVGTNSMGVIAAARVDELAESPGRVGLTQTFRTIAETEATISYTVRRTGGRSGAVSVGYATTAGEALTGSDFESATGTLSWADGDSGDRTISIGIVGDAEVEPDESFALTLSGPTGGVRLAASEATATITSDDGPGEIRFLFPLDSYRLGENAGTIPIPVVRRGGSQGAVGVRYGAGNGSATEGADFAPIDGALDWADGEIGIKYLSVEILQDSLAEAKESFVVCLSDPTGGAIVSEPFGRFQIVTIIDDDGPDNGGGGSVSCLSAGGGGGGGGGGGSGNGVAGGGGGVGAFALLGLALLALRRRPAAQSR
jgi:uncharacterized delta-60 repeat protein